MHNLTTFLKYFAFLFIIAFAVFNYSDAATAATGTCLICNARKTMYDKVMSSFDVALPGTTMIWGSATDVDKPFFQIFGVSMDEGMNCVSKWGEQGILATTDAGNMLRDLGANTTDDETCDSLGNEYLASNGRFDKQAFARGKVAGSLLGYANMVESTVKYEPVPVNMAFFFKQYAAKLPIVGDQVFAADMIGGVDYQHTLIVKILSIWQIFRNIAYATMSLIMLWTGLAIIMKKKISQQVVVNVQYALPKIVIALVLIAFSYPIGATITSLGWTLYHSADAIVKSLAGAGSPGGFMTQYLGNIGVGRTAIVLVSILFSISGIGMLAGLLMIIALLTVIIMGTWAMLKAMFIYMKMVAYIAISPLQIAMYAIPGQDDKLANWFKQMIAWMLGLFAIAVIQQLTQAFAWTLMEDALTVSGGVFTQVASAVEGVMFAYMTIPLVFIFGYGFAVKAPNLIESAIMGPPKRK